MLCDQEIFQLLNSNPPILSPLPGVYSRLPANDLAWQDYSSPVQPASIDLHAGKIYIPGRLPGKVGSHDNGSEAYTIKQGESVIVSTYEKLNLPNDISGIVFPPSGRLSSRAILVSNIGHIDPGFQGHLRFTLINMGNEPFVISSEKDIVGTLLLFRTTTVNRGWHDRACAAGRANAHGGKAEPDQHEIDALAPDFAGMEKRMRKIADERINGLRYLFWNAGIPVILSALVSIGLYLYSNAYGQLDKLETQTAEFQKELLSQEKEILRLHEKIINLTAGNKQKTISDESSATAN